MSLQEKLKSSAPQGLKIIGQHDQMYHYARVISNTRFGYQPSAIAYCRNATDVKYCIDFCLETGYQFRVRSGGHQHEGMCSANDVLIIDLSEINTIEYPDGYPDRAWIPAGKQLETAYAELEERNQVIPGGACQSVNVGGLTQGGGWGLSVRKFGLTCDNIIEVEIILPNGDIEIVSKENHPDIFWALKGGGGGNFGVVTRFLFQLSELTPKVTNFAMQWTDRKEVEYAVSTFMNLHAKTGEDELDPALSSFCAMILADPKKKGETRKLKDGQHSLINCRMVGQFYGSKADLITLLQESYPDLKITEAYFSMLKQVPEEPSKDQKMNLSTSKKATVSHHQSKISDFLNMRSTNFSDDPVEMICPDRDLRILPNAPSSTCDRPHPHKVSSSFPKEYTPEKNKEMTERIYDLMAASCYYPDVNKYMSFHCLGGAIRKNPESRVFAFSEKPYMLQIQCWWDDISNAFTNQTRNEEYVKWVENLRKNLSPATEGSFFNFVDYHLVENPSTEDGKLELLEIYYGKENLEKLRMIKTEHDQRELFKFRMSIPPFK